MGGKNYMARGRPLIRQWNLLKAIQNHRFGINTDDLTERGECSKRQILRDINILQDAGFTHRSSGNDAIAL
jgi:predicted DNA-binding transcriptional regulator YafY